MFHKFGDEGSIRLLVCTVLVTTFFVVKFIYKRFDASNCCFGFPLDRNKSQRMFDAFRTPLAIGTALFIVIYIIMDISMETPRNLTSLTGVVFFVIALFVFSHDPSGVKWRPVFWGLALQFLFALLILRWHFGLQAFKWLGQRVYEFLSYTDKGSMFVFGEKYTDHFFAFKALTVVVFFSTTVSVLYYLGVMQFIICNIARFMASTLGTSPTESLNAAANIFIGHSEAPLLIKPFLPDMTNSELHAVLTGGFATIAGTVMAAYILINVPANHLLSASVMSAPAALALSKLIYPETNRPQMDPDKVYQMDKGPERNVIEAASNGASQSITLIANIAVNMIAFIAMLEFVNATLDWFGARVGLEPPEYERLTFQFLCSYIFWPIAAMMGVDLGDCRKVAEMIGTKIFINELVAYTELSVYMDNNYNLTWYQQRTRNITSGVANGSDVTRWYYSGDDIVYTDLNITLRKGIMSDRSIVISTYALCGFSNISSLGIMLGALGALAPSRKTDVSALVISAMVTGNAACFMTACIAGLLYRGEV
ncbi:solute carrier family 28 member 3-like [Pecten maximus]|uniref:solute carrier family 28 member 3-like n=1 Tax=Pecten maximus TaxID=6579 RepID=UPI0014583A02|nr:solute carrier family 28 member 3-like [Pecten maximus]